MKKLINFKFTDTEWYFMYEDNNEVFEITLYDIIKAEQFSIVLGFDLNFSGCSSC